MKGLLIAMQFLTIIPIRLTNIDDKKISDSMVYFPIVGLLLGMVLVGMNHLLFILSFPQISIDIILVISLIILTGGMHLDGLSDTFDALFSRKNKDEMLKIMRDSHVGVLGALGIISAILLKIAFLYSIDISLKPPALILMCVLSRWSQVFSMFLFPYARQEGKAKIFIEGINSKIIIFTTSLVLIVTIGAWNTKGILVFLIAGLCAYLIGKSVSRKIGGITGDTLGATGELIEVTVLICVCLMERVSLLWKM